MDGLHYLEQNKFMFAMNITETWKLVLTRKNKTWPKKKKNLSENGALEFCS